MQRPGFSAAVKLDMTKAPPAQLGLELAVPACALNPDPPHLWSVALISALCIAAATAAVGALGYFKKTFATFWAIPVLLIYPLSILMVWGLDRAGLK